MSRRPMYVVERRIVRDGRNATRVARCQAILPGSTQTCVRKCARRGTVEVHADYLYLCIQHAKQYLQRGLDWA